MLKFKFFADCIPVRGFRRGIIYDLNRSLYKFVPITMIDFIEEGGGKTKKDIRSSYPKELLSTVDQYFNFLEANEYIHWAPAELENNFPKLSLKWDYPAQISNAILDIGVDEKYDVSNVLKQLEELGCKHIQLRAYGIKPLSFYTDILSRIAASSYASIEIIMPYSISHSEEEIKLLVAEHKRVKAIIFFSAPENKIINETDIASLGNIAFTQQKISSTSNFHNNSKEYFNVSVQLFTEALRYNVYFNRKASIDIDGNIKNCNSQDYIFGNVNTCTISKVVNTISFQKLWHVKKDNINGCKDCEFRYMCADSRTPHHVNNEVWSHKTECNYNPYLAKWKGEDGYKTLAECGIVSNKMGFKINKQKLAKINREIWGE